MSTLYVKVENGQVVGNPEYQPKSITIDGITYYRVNNTQTFTDEQMLDAGYYVYYEPNYNSGVERLGGYVLEGGVAIREIVPLTDDEINANIVVDRQRRIAELWKAAHDYEMYYISGSAIGMLTMLVSKGNEKGIAVMSWIQSIWTEYYTRKALINQGFEVTYDFSFAGDMPYSVPELMQEFMNQ